jgi:heme O synthase-like polyprenyltransferase
MLSRFDKTGRVTARSTLFYSSLLLPIPACSTVSGLTSSMFFVDGFFLNAYLCHLSYRFYKNPSRGSAREVFFCSLWHLPLLLALFAFHKLKRLVSTIISPLLNIICCAIAQD